MIAKFLFVLVLLFGEIASYQNCKQLSHAGKSLLVLFIANSQGREKSEADFFLRWDINSTHLRVQIEAVTTGWIGMGISLDGTMSSGGRGSPQNQATTFS